MRTLQNHLPTTPQHLPPPPLSLSLSLSFAPLTQSAEREKMFWETQKLWKPTFFFLRGVWSPSQHKKLSKLKRLRRGRLNRKKLQNFDERNNKWHPASLVCGWLWGIDDLKALGSLNSDLGKYNPPEFRSPKLENSSFFGPWLARSIFSSSFLSRGHTNRQAGAHSLRGRGKPARRITYPNAFPIRFPQFPVLSSSWDSWFPLRSQSSRTLETHGSHVVPDALQHLRFSVPIVFPLLHQPNVTLDSHHVPNSYHHHTRFPSHSHALQQPPHLDPTTFPCSSTTATPSSHHVPMLFNNRYT